VIQKPKPILQSNEQIENRWSPLYSVCRNYVQDSILKKRNSNKDWKYGYDHEYDFVVISRDGTIGDVYDIDGLKIALPATPSKINYEHNKWVPHQVPVELSKIKSMTEWRLKDRSFRERHTPYIEEEFNRRDQGYWFINNKKPTYLTGHHYMYLQHTKIDVGLPDFREANRVLFIYWEAVKADPRSFGMIYLKIRRSGFSYMEASVGVDTATLAYDSRIGILSKTGPDAKKLFTDKVVPIAWNYPFFFKPMQSGMDRPKTELIYSLPAKKITKNNMHDMDDDPEGLNTSIDWKNTDDNSYDGEKLLLLLHDESGKILKPNSIKNSWNVTKTCLRVGSKIIGKCMMGSTSNALSKGGQEFKDLYEASDPRIRSANGQTKSGLSKLFIPMEWNFEGFIDEFGMPVFETPKKPVMGIDGQWITMGVIDYWENELENLKDDPDRYNEFLRQFPRKESHAFRDESNESIFDLTKIYDQIEYNESMVKEKLITQGRFDWKNGEKYSEVIWTPDPRGRFFVSWMPPREMQNNVLKKNGVYYPGNEELGAFGCDSYDISGVVSGSGSKGALHGLTKTNMLGAPSNFFFLEYVARPSTADEFFDDVIKAVHFYGMQVLVENNKVGLLRHMKNNGYRKFSMNRPDKPKEKLSKNEIELGGIPNTSEDVKQTHADMIDSYIKQYVGYDKSGQYRDQEEIGDMYFVRTLLDWAGFQINNRTKYDASISSGLAIMATRKHKLVPERKNSKISFNFVRYKN
jgi:hypothetical protein